MARTYVPGYGYVDSNDPGTRGSVKPGPKPRMTGQEPIVQNPIYITRPSAPYGAAEEDSIVIRTEPLFDFSVDFPEPTDYGVGSAEALERADQEAQLAAELGQDNFNTRQRAEQVADINDGYVVREDDGTYRVVYGIYAQQAAARDRQAAAATPSNYQNLPVDQTAGAPSNYQGLPSSMIPPSGAESNDGQYIGSTFSTDPTRFAPRYTVTQSVVDASLNQPALLTVQQLTDYQQSNDSRGFLVYMGEVTTAGSTGATAVENYQDARFVGNYLNLPDEQRQQVFNLVNRYYPKYWEPSYVQGIWEKAVRSASEQLLVQGKKVSPFGIFEETIAAAAAADAERNASRGGFYGGGGYGGGGGGARQTIVLTSPTDAWVILNQAMQQYFGRKASENELSKFVKMLNAQERANPVVQSVDGTTSLQEGGFNPQLFAEQFVQSKEGAGEYAAATTFLDTFISILEGDNGVL